MKQNRWQPFDGKLWQRNFYEQIVRDGISLNADNNTGGAIRAQPI
jgi:hypothetical protein